MNARRGTQVAAICAGLLPLGWLLFGLVTDALGANPIEEITHFTGKCALRFLIATLAVTPLRRWLGWNRLAPLRRTFGLFAFFYAALHLATFVGLNHFFLWSAIFEDVVERPFVTAGAGALLAMLTLAVTSTRGWIRRLGKRWVTLHRLVWVAALLAIVHYVWLVKADLQPPLVHAAILVALLAARYVPIPERGKR